MCDTERKCLYRDKQWNHHWLFPQCGYRQYDQLDLSEFNNLDR